MIGTLTLPDMATSSTSTELGFKRTRSAVIATGLLSEPLLTLIYTFIPFLLYRDLHATAFMVTVLIMLKPVVSIFSMYWSHPIKERRDLLVPNVILSGILGRLPFLFFPWVTNPWVVIGCAAFYIMSYRGGNPAWMEILKLNIPKEKRAPIFSFGASLGYAEGVVLAVGVGALMDQDVTAWRWLFPSAALLGMLSTMIQSRVQVPIDTTSPKRSLAPKSWREQLLEPWQNARALMNQRPDFNRFQWGFMFCGAGLMIIKPALPIFYVDILKISYTDLAIAISVCKGLGFSLSSPMWARWMNRADIFTLCGWVCLLVALFPFLILFSQAHNGWLYTAYFLYGIGQAGSHLCWHMSGPIFAADSDSSLFSSVNVVMVGIRGTIIPLLGGLLCAQWGCFLPLLVGTMLCLAGGALFFQQRQLAAVQA